MENKPLVSVIIPAFNEEQTIAHSLDSLVAQQTSHPFEVIVVDNNCTDKTADIARQYDKKLCIRVVKQPIQGRGAARNMGHKKAKGKYLFSTDADALVPRNWIEQYMNIFESNMHVCSVTSSSKILDCSWRINTTYNLLHPLLMHVYRILFGSYLLCGYGCATTRNAYHQSGGYCIRNNGQEDVDLTKRVKNIGRIAYAKHVPIIFSGRRFRHGLLIGYWEYFRVFIGRMVLKKEHIHLSDKR